MHMKNFKIIPLLVFVALLSFSVRLVDVVTGLSSLSGEAHAEVHEPEGHGEVPMPSQDELKLAAAENTEPPEGGLVFSDEEAEEKMAARDETMHDDTDVDLPEWRDPMTEDPAYDATRMELFDELARRRKELDGREKQLNTREALLQAADQELNRKYLELTQLRQEIERLLEEQSEEEQARIKSLVKIYEGMKPKDAARIFDTLDLDILVAVVAQMSERKLSPVLAAMNPERARTITIMLAEQKQLPTLPGSN